MTVFAAKAVKSTPKQEHTKPAPAKQFGNSNGLCLPLLALLLRRVPFGLPCRWQRQVWQELVGQGPGQVEELQQWVFVGQEELRKPLVKPGCERLVG